MARIDNIANFARNLSQGRFSTAPLEDSDSLQMGAPPANSGRVQLPSDLSTNLPANDDDAIEQIKGAGMGSVDAPPRMLAGAPRLPSDDQGGDQGDDHYTSAYNKRIRALTGGRSYVTREEADAYRKQAADQAQDETVREQARRDIAKMNMGFQQKKLDSQQTHWSNQDEAAKSRAHTLAQDAISKGDFRTAQQAYLGIEGQTKAQLAASGIQMNDAQMQHLSTEDAINSALAYSHTNNEDAGTMAKRVESVLAVMHGIHVGDLNAGPDVRNALPTLAQDVLTGPGSNMSATRAGTSQVTDLAGQPPPANKAVPVLPPPGQRVTADQMMPHAKPGKAKPFAGGNYQELAQKAVRAGFEGTTPAMVQELEKKKNAGNPKAIARWNQITGVGQ